MVYDCKSCYGANVVTNYSSVFNNNPNLIHLNIVKSNSINPTSIDDTLKDIKGDYFKKPTYSQNYLEPYSSNITMAPRFENEIIIASYGSKIRSSKPPLYDYK